MTKTTAKRFALLSDHGFYLAMQTTGARHWNEMYPGERRARRAKCVEVITRLIADATRGGTHDVVEISSGLAHDLVNDSHLDEMPVGGSITAGAASVFRIA